jgi:hypothetical protein
MKKLTLTAVFLFIGIFLMTLILAQDSDASFEYRDLGRKDKRSFDAAIGFTIDPDTFLFAPGIDFFITNEISLGPNIQLGVSDRFLVVSAAANCKIVFDIRTDDFMRRFKPSIQFGAGVAMVNINPRSTPSDTDVGALFNMGFGFDIFLTDKISLGNHMLFNILTPDINDRFLFSWQFVTFKYWF